MTLPNCLREVLRMLGDIGCSRVTIARASEGPHAYQVRFTPDKERSRGYAIEGRRWMDGTEVTPTRGTESAYVGWARWSNFFGWGPESVLADDWTILA